MILARLPADRGARRKLLEGFSAGEVRGPRAELHALAAKFGRRAAQQIGADDARAALVGGVAPADRQRHLIAQRIGEIAEDRPGPGAHIARGRGAQPGQEHRVGGRQHDIENVARPRVQIIGAQDPLQLFAFIEHLEFVRELPVAVDGGHIDIGGGQAVEIDRGLAAVLPPGDDVLERDRLVQRPFGGARQAICLHILGRAGQPGAGVEHVVKHRRA